MSLVTKSLANLIGGISQQAPPLRLFNQCEEQENFKSSPINGLQSRGPATIAGIGGQAGAAFYPIDSADGDIYNLCVSPAGVYVMDDVGTWQTIQHSEGWENYLSIPAGTDPFKAYKVLTLIDHTYILNTTKVAALTSARYNAWRNQALVFIKQVNYSTTWTLTINGVSRSVGYGGTETDGTIKAYVDGAQTSIEVAASSSFVAGRLSEIAVPGFTITHMQSVLWIRRNDGGVFSIGMADTRGNTYSSLVTTKVQQFNELPTIAPNGYVCLVVGLISSDTDNYYVKFVADGGATFGRGVWEECAEPNAQYQIDPATMPWALKRVSGSSWTFSTVPWVNKETGDDKSNPIPSFIGKRINNLLLFRNRLCVIADDQLCMSRAGDYENWWSKSSMAMVDSDPIYISASTEHLVNLIDFGVLNDTLILFGENDQFALSTPDTLSPRTAALLPASTAAFTNGTGIVPVGTSLYFGYKTGNYYTCGQLTISSATGQKENMPITSHVPNLIPFGEYTRLSGSPNVNCLAVITGARPNTIFLYQYYIAGAQKLQSAWHKYVFEGCIIKGCFFRENILWMLVQKREVMFIATLNLAEITVDASPVCIDFPITMSASEAKTDWTLPNYLDPARTLAIARLADGSLMLDIITNINGQVVTLNTPVTTVTFGEKIKRIYEFSTQYPSTTKNGNTVAITSGRWQLQQLTLFFDFSGPFTIRVKPTYDNNAEGFRYNYGYSGITIGAQGAVLGRQPLGSGQSTTPLRGRNTDLRVLIESDSWLPGAFISAEWQGSYITKVREI